MDFIVLLYSIKSPLSMEYNVTSVSKIPNITNQLIEKVHLDDLDLYVVMFAAFATSV